MASFQGSVHVLPITEIVTDNDFFDYAAKYEGKSQEITPARLDEVTLELIQKTSVEIYKKLNLNGVIRVDYIIEKGEPFVIEINTIPGFSEESIIPKQLKTAHLKLSEVFEICFINIQLFFCKFSQTN